MMVMQMKLTPLENRFSNDNRLLPYITFVNIDINRQEDPLEFIDSKI